MQFSSRLAVAILLATACASDPAPTAEGSTSGGSTGPEQTSSGESSSSAPASSSGGESTDAQEDASSSSTGAEPLQPLELDRAWVAGLEGAWLGPVLGTPLGDLPQFYWEFAWTEADALVGMADSGMGFRVEFEFAQKDGQWTLTETGTAPGNQTQTYVLHPVAREGDVVRFEVLDQPGYLQVDILPGEGTFEMAVFVRGAAHGTFDLTHPG